MGAYVNKEKPIFFNQQFDKKRLKALISWVFKQSGEAEALRVVDLLKETGFKYATKAGISIGLHDLTTPIQKSWLISESQVAITTTERDFVGARITATERSQRIVDTWHRASESLSKQVVDYFAVYDRFNPVYIMALSGARGNFSQVRQLIGMRGLMADQQGKIVNFPIRSNLREGLTLTEYFISCSGARKGLVDTALRTADTGYLTRRLVDVSHHVVVKRIRCNTNRGIAFRSLQSYNKTLLALKERLVGRVLAEDVFFLGAKQSQTLQSGALAGFASDKCKPYNRCNYKTPFCQELGVTCVTCKAYKAKLCMTPLTFASLCKASPCTCAKQKCAKLCKAYKAKLCMPCTCEFCNCKKICSARHTSRTNLLANLLAKQSFALALASRARLRTRARHTKLCFVSLAKRSKSDAKRSKSVQSKSEGSLTKQSFVCTRARHTKLCFVRLPSDKSKICSARLRTRARHTKLCFVSLAKRSKSDAKQSKSDARDARVQSKSVQNQNQVTPSHKRLQPQNPVLSCSCKGQNKDIILNLLSERGRPIFERSHKSIAKKDQEISLKLALKIAEVRDKVYLRSPLTCAFTHSVCQLCYGWSISQGSLVSLGDAVGVIAAQSIGEPGTQLTMRTFHTGGVFSGDLLQEIKAPHAGKVEFGKACHGLLIRTAHGHIAFLSKTQGRLVLKGRSGNAKKSNNVTTISIPPFSMLFVRQGERVEKNQLLAEFSIRTKEGNQPIKTQQTVFAQISGKVVEDCSGKVYTKSVKEDHLLASPLEGYSSPLLLQSRTKAAKTGNKTRFCNLNKAYGFAAQTNQRLVSSCKQLARTSFWTYKVKDAKQNKIGIAAGADAYATQVVSSFSSYNGYISAKRANDQSTLSSFKAPFTESLQESPGFVRKIKALVPVKIGLCNPSTVYNTSHVKMKGFLHKNRAFQSSREKVSQTAHKPLYLLMKASRARVTNTNQRFVSSFVCTLLRHVQLKNFLLCTRASANLRFTRNFARVTKQSFIRSFAQLRTLLLRTLLLRTRARLRTLLRSKSDAKLCKSEGSLTKQSFVCTRARLRTLLRSKSDAKLRFARLRLARDAREGSLTKLRFVCTRARLRTLLRSKSDAKLRFARLRLARDAREGSHTKLRFVSLARVPSKSVRSFASINLCSSKSFARVQNRVFFLFLLAKKKKQVTQGGLLSFCKVRKTACSTLFGPKRQDLNVLHGVQDEILQKIFNTSTLTLLRKNRFSEERASNRAVSLHREKEESSSVCKAQILFSQKSYDLENDAFKQIEPVKSGRLGFLKILSVRVGATLDYISPVKSVDKPLKKKRKSVSPFLIPATEHKLSDVEKSDHFRSFSGNCNKALSCKTMQKQGCKYLHPESIKESRFFLETIAGYGDVVEEGYPCTTLAFDRLQ